MTDENLLKLNHAELIARVTNLKQSLSLAVSALELACELLPVPEHRQDEVWYDKEKQVYEALAKITGKAE